MQCPTSSQQTGAALIAATLAIVLVHVLTVGNVPRVLLTNVAKKTSAIAVAGRAALNYLERIALDVVVDEVVRWI